jgi:hypothetical protein
MAVFTTNTSPISLTPALVICLTSQPGPIQGHLGTECLQATQRCRHPATGDDGLLHGRRDRLARRVCGCGNARRGGFRRSGRKPRGRRRPQVVCGPPELFWSTALCCGRIAALCRRPEHPAAVSLRTVRSSPGCRVPSCWKCSGAPFHESPTGPQRGPCVDELPAPKRHSLTRRSDTCFDRCHDEAERTYASAPRRSGACLQRFMSSHHLRVTSVDG